MLKKIYNFLAYLYSYFFYFFENFFYKKNYQISNLHEKGYELIDVNGFINYKFIVTKKFVNKYMSKDLLSNEDMHQSLKYIFINLNLKNIITNKTGLNFSIDYAIIYETFPIENNDKNQQWYANHWHIDKPFSRNTLKLIMPIENDILEESGGIEVLEKSQKNKSNNCNFKNTFKMIASVNQALLFYPNICYHKARSPRETSRKQIMIQLNPSQKWRINKNIAIKQKNAEPKFPLIAYFFDDYLYIN